ncbi:SNF2-related protein [Paenibacillus jamilae]|uniref:SNF2-related protein n=1 Tax=Paenibacillus jamilae TaxID=114136 RepID=UPI003D29491C
MSRIKPLHHLYASAIADVTSSGDAWQHYLHFAASIYKYSFDNSLLIYAQRPNATMLAPLPLWNELGRYVKRGEKSIAVCDFQQGSPTLSHLFDVNQTTGRQVPVLWSLGQLDTDELAGRLTSYDTLNLAEAISQLVHDTVLSSWEEWLQDIEHEIHDHFLGSIPLLGLEQHMGDLIEDSVRYLIHRRCQLPEPNHTDFSTITHFDTLPLAARLGYQVNTHARSLLTDIARYVKIMEQERSLAHESSRQTEVDIPRNRRIAVSEPAHLERSDNRPAAFGQIRAAGPESSSKSSSTTLSDSSNGRQPDDENAPGRTGGAGTDGAVDRSTASPSSHAADRRHVEKSTASESNQIDSRGTDHERHHSETTITEANLPSSPSSEPPISGSFFMPNEGPVLSGTRTGEDMLAYLLISGRGATSGKERIYQFIVDHHPVKASDLIAFLKPLYGIGGAKGDLGSGLVGYMTDSKGVQLSWQDVSGSHEEQFKWKKISDTLLQLISQGHYDEQFVPFPPVELEWTLFDYAKEQAEIEDVSGESEGQNDSPKDAEDRHQDTHSLLADVNKISGDPSLSPDTQPKLPAAVNYRFQAEQSPYVSGAKSKYKRNVEAIRLLKQLESEQRQATIEEQHILAGYVGWGGLANAFHPNANGWETEYAELKQLLDEDEYAAARNSTITAFYTEQSLIQTIHATLQRFGLTSGAGRRLLEPSMGSGNFFSVLPPEWENAELHGVELDSLTGRISQKLYPKANIHIQGFETIDWRKQRFDAIFSNIPFHNIRIHDRRYSSSHYIHDYFFIRSLDLLKPGGILAFIVSKGTMDKQDSSVRQILAQKAELIGMVRLPNTTFQSLAGATVTTDIVFLQKRESPLSLPQEDMPEWIEIGETSEGVPVNRYYLSHPEMMLGQMQWDRGMYGAEKTSACIPYAGQPLLPALEKALDTLEARFPDLPNEVAQTKNNRSPLLPDEEEEPIRKAPPGTKNFTFFVEQERIYYCENGLLLPQDIKGKKAERIKGLCAIRAALLDVIEIQSREYGYEADELEQAQSRLNYIYDRFVHQYGTINERANTSAFADDDQLPLLRSIEDLTADKTWIKAAIFSRPTIRVNALPEHTDDPLEALQICLNHRLRIDLPYIAHLCNKTTDEVREALGERIFQNPQAYTGDADEGWELDEEYLSGNVKDKLAYAMLKAQEYPDVFQRNVAALTRVQPAPLLPGDIDFRIGSPWIPVKVYRTFMYETFGTARIMQDSQTIDVDYLEYTNTWRVSGKSLERGSIKVNQTFGTRRANAYEIFESSLNLQSITVRDPVTYLDANGNEQIKYVVNAKETMIARAKQQQMKEAFASWLFRDKDRADALLSIYNDKFNTIRPRTYDGDHLVFQGMNQEMSLRKHQRDVAARIIYSGTALMAHEVGAGKTAAMIAAGMYLKRIGAVHKPLYCVPNHLTEQWANEFLRFFPSANVLVTTKKDFTLANRQRFVSKIAMGNYDAVIIGHSQFEKIPISRERQEQLLQDEIRNVSHMINQMKKEKGDNWSIKQMVVFENNLKSRLERLMNETKKDNLLTFEQLGVDMLFVDEAHAYKNCFTFTKMRNVAGIGKSSSQRATDMLLKCQYLQEMNQGRGVVFATGTPISNSMSEMYVMQRFLQPHLLQKLGLNFFDNWAATFGEVVSSLEITPEGSGYRMKSRFAKFHNLPELMSMFRLVADIQTADMLKLPVPRLEGDKASVVVSECSPYQEQMMEEFVERAEKIRNNEVDAKEDNMLKLTHEAKLMSIDPRLVHEDAPVDLMSKLNLCINNVFDIWQETQANRLTQVIFSDSGTPKPGQFNVYDEMKSQLVVRGIPEQEIAFIHDVNTDAAREALFEQVRRGEVRILLGSTQKMGTGTNIQTKLIAAHHIDCPWRPSDIIQRDGRILRQGNQNETVRIFRYVTKGTFDSYLWQIQEQKLRYISQVMTGRSISRSCQDADETVLSAAEVKAVAVGNPMLAEKMEVDNEVIRLKLLKTNWHNEQVMLERQLSQHYPQMLTSCAEKLEQYQADWKLVEQHQLHDFSITLDGMVYTERPQAGEVLLLLSKVTELEHQAIKVGQFKDFDIMLSRPGFEHVQLHLRRTATYTVELGDSALGNINRMENLLEKIPAKIEATKQQQQDTLHQIETAKREIGKPFEFEDRLSQFVARQSEINSALEFKELQEQAVMDDPEDEQQNEGLVEHKGIEH